MDSIVKRGTFQYYSCTNGTIFHENMNLTASRESFRNGYNIYIYDIHVLFQSCIVFWQESLHQYQLSLNYEDPHNSKINIFFLIL